MHICLFDIDGTLISSGGAGKQAMEGALAKEFGVELEEDHISYAGRTDRSIAGDLFRFYNIENSAENWQQFRAAYLALLPACLAERNGRILQGVSELLLTLSGSDRVALGLLTGNMREGAHAKLGHFGLAEYFAFGGFGDDHHDRDDVARGAIVQVEQHFSGNFDREQVWVIGDTPFDIRCGRAIGARVIAVATGSHTLEELKASQPDFLLPHLEDATSLFEAWGV